VGISEVEGVRKHARPERPAADDGVAALCGHRNPDSPRSNANTLAPVTPA